MRYDQLKGLSSPKVEKSPKQKFLLPSQVSRVLDTIRESDRPEIMKMRDHGIIFLGFHLGLRCGEIGLVSRDAFRALGDGTAYIRSLKKSPRLPVTCACGRRFNVSIARIGQDYPCPRCGDPVPVGSGKKPKKRDRFPEIQIPIPEEKVREYIRKYLDSMPMNQRHLFISRPACRTRVVEIPLSATHTERIFAMWAMASGLDPVFSFHALRHGRGVQLYEATENLKFVQTCLRHESMRTSEIYVHLSPRVIDEYSEALDARAIG